MNKAKAIGLFRLRLVEIFTPFRGYGQDVFVPEAQQHILEAALRLHHELEDKEEAAALTIPQASE